MTSEAQADDLVTRFDAAVTELDNVLKAQWRLQSVVQIHPLSPRTATIVAELWELRTILVLLKRACDKFFRAHAIFESYMISPKPDGYIPPSHVARAVYASAEADGEIKVLVKSAYEWLYHLHELIDGNPEVSISVGAITRLKAFKDIRTPVSGEWVDRLGEFGIFSVT